MPSVTRDQKSFTLDLPAGVVTFSFPSRRSTRITIPRGSKWAPGAHWHEHYVENTRVLQGRVKFVVDGREFVKGPDDGVVTFPKFAVHNFCRADGGTTTEGEGDEDVVIEEWTTPEDGFKQVFFYNVMSTFQDATATSAGSMTEKATLSASMVLQLLTTIAWIDNYVDPLPFLPHTLSTPLLGSVVFGVKYLLTHSIYTVGAVVGRAAGYPKWFKEYTPQELWEVADRGAATSTEKTD